MKEVKKNFMKTSPCGDESKCELDLVKKATYNGVKWFFHFIAPFITKGPAVITNLQIQKLLHGISNTFF